MENTKRFLGILIVALASTALFVACSDDESCLADSDCADAADVCEGDICVQGCAIGSGECAEGEECVARASGDGGYCAAGGDNNTTNNVNNTTPTNNGTTPVGTQGYIVQILDTSSGDESCGATVNDPGSDIVFVSLEDSTGNVLGYGSLVTDGITGDPNNFADGFNLDGTAPSFTGDCPEFNADNVTALGCGGFVAVEFWDTSGNPVMYETGMDIRVFEFGGLCSTGSVTDEYDVILCSDTDAVKNNDDISSCTNTLAGGSGETTFTIN